MEDLTNFLNSHTSLSDMRLEALQHVGSASAFRSQMVGLSFWTYGIHTFIDGWAGWSLAKSFIDTRPKNGAPGYDVAAIFVKEDQCAMVFSGTSGLADITTDFTLMFSIPATTCHVDCMAFTRAFSTTSSSLC